MLRVATVVVVVPMVTELTFDAETTVGLTFSPDTVPVKVVLLSVAPAIVPPLRVEPVAVMVPVSVCVGMVVPLGTVNVVGETVPPLNVAEVKFAVPVTVGDGSEVPDGAFSVVGDTVPPLIVPLFVVVPDSVALLRVPEPITVPAGRFSVDGESVPPVITPLLVVVPTSVALVNDGFPVVGT
jgi:hypothetical protein